MYLLVHVLLKVLDLQSRYKSDKRFVLDERFIDDKDETKEEKEGAESIEEDIELQQKDEKEKQLNILQDVLGVAIKTSRNDDASSKKKSKYDITLYLKGLFIIAFQNTKNTYYI